MADTPTARRRFLARAASLAVAAPLLAAATGRAFAAPLPKLPLTHPTAKSLHYVEDFHKTDQKSHKPGSHCLNCQFFTPGTNACALFAGFSVETNGWCAAWAKKA